MHIKLIIRQCGWLLLIPLLVGCGAAVTVTPAAIDTPTAINLDAFATQIAGTVVAGITQTAYRTPTATFPPTGTPNPTYTPAPVYAPDGKRKALIIDGNLYIQTGNGKNVQLTNSKTDMNPLFSDDGKKIVFYRWGDLSFYVIDAAGGKEKQIIDVQSLAVQDGGKVKALTFLKNMHILVFNLYLCGERPGLYDAADCFVNTYSVNIDSGELKEVGQRVSGTEFDNGNFEISPNQKNLSIAGSGHINIFSFSDGYFKLAYLGVFDYKMTRPDEFLPYQYWLPDSSGLIIVAAAGGSNAPPDPPSGYDVFRYSLGNKAVQIDGIHPELGYEWRMGCTVSLSPDRNWMFLMSDSAHLVNLKDGRSQAYDLDELPCSAIQWSPDSKHFGVGNLRYGRVGSVDGSPMITLAGSFDGWIDATHYSYTVGDDTRNLKEYIAEIGGASILLSTPTPTSTP